MENKTPWYDKIYDKVGEVVRKYDLPEDISADIRLLAMDVAKEQYRVGNNSGISWLRRELSKTGQPAMSAA